MAGPDQDSSYELKIADSAGKIVCTSSVQVCVCMRELACRLQSFGPVSSTAVWWLTGLVYAWSGEPKLRDQFDGEK